MKYLITIFSIILSTSILRSQIPSNDGSWQSIFLDNFNSIDAITWQYAYPWGPINNGLEYNKNINVTIDNGWLKVKADTLIPPEHEIGKSTLYYYQGGGLWSIAHYKYGYYEVESKMPYGRGLWPAFWVQFGGSAPKDCGWYNEIDINEPNGEDSHTNKFGSGYWLKGPPVPSRGDSCFTARNWPEVKTNISNPNLAHKYAVLWEPNRMTWYLDDQVIHSITDINNTPDHALALIVNFAIDPGNPPNGTTIFPAYYLINYFRVDQLKTDCNKVENICSFNKATYDFKLKKSIKLGGSGCTSDLNTQDQIALWATDYILLDENTSLISNSTGYISMNVSACPSP